MKLLKPGHIVVDCFMIGANTSKFKALSRAQANQIEAQPRQEVHSLLALTKQRDWAGAPDGSDVPAGIARREDRLNALAQAKTKALIEQRAGERFNAEQRAFETKQAKRRAQRLAGKWPRGKDPAPTGRPQGR